MQIKICKSSLEQALSVADKLADAKGTMPILANILVETDDFTWDVRLIATDLQVTLAINLQAEIIEQGSITLNSKNLLGLIKKTKAHSLTIKTDGDFAHISADGLDAMLPMLPIEDFPAHPKIDGEPQLEIDAQDLLRHLASVQYCIASDQTRYALNGCLMQLDKGELIFCSTDGHRLAVNSCAPRLKLSANMPDNIHAILPWKALQMVFSAWAKVDEPLKITKSDGHISIQSEDVVLTSRLLEGQFPNYKQAIPKEHKINVRANANALIGALNKVATLSDEKTRMVKLFIDEKSLTVVSSDADKGEVKESLVCSSTGKINIGFNARYLIQALDAWSTTSANLQLKDADNQVVIQSGNYKALIMPMRI